MEIYSPGEWLDEPISEPAARSRNRRRGLGGITTTRKGEPNVRGGKCSLTPNPGQALDKGQLNSTVPPKGSSDRIGPPSGNSETMGYWGSTEDCETSDESSVYGLPVDETEGSATVKIMTRGKYQTNTRAENIKAHNQTANKQNIKGRVIAGDLFYHIETYKVHRFMF